MHVHKIHYNSKVESVLNALKIDVLNVLNQIHVLDVSKTSLYSQIILAYAHKLIKLLIISANAHCKQPNTKTNVYNAKYKNVRCVNKLINVLYVWKAI